MHPACSLMESDFASVLSSRSSDEYRTSVVKFARRLGFDSVSATLITDRVDGETTFEAVHNTPMGISSTSGERTRDPVMQHCKHHSVPIVWNQSTYLAAGAIDQWEVQAQFG